MSPIRLMFTRVDAPGAPYIRIFDDVTGEEINDVVSLILYVNASTNYGAMTAHLTHNRNAGTTLARVAEIEIDA